MTSVHSCLEGARGIVGLGLKASALLLASMLFIAVAAAQTPNKPIVDGRQQQPTQQQLESTGDRNAVEWERWNRRVAPELDHLNDEILRATQQP